MAAVVGKFQFRLADKFTVFAGNRPAWRRDPPFVVGKIMIKSFDLHKRPRHMVFAVGQYGRIPRGLAQVMAEVESPLIGGTICQLQRGIRHKNFRTPEIFAHKSFGCNIAVPFAVGNKTALIGVSIGNGAYAVDCKMHITIPAPGRSDHHFHRVIGKDSAIAFGHLCPEFFIGFKGNMKAHIYAFAVMEKHSCTGRSRSFGVMQKKLIKLLSFCPNSIIKFAIDHRCGSGGKYR